MVVDEHKYGKVVQIRKNDEDWCRMCNYFFKCGVRAMIGYSAADIQFNLHEHFFLSLFHFPVL